VAILPIDTGRYGTKEMMQIFSEQKKVDYQLQIEGAAAIAQSEIGVIPKEVGKKINQAANSGKITAKRCAVAQNLRWNMKNHPPQRVGH